MKSIPDLALGTWLMGGTKEADPNNDDQADISVIQTALENDINLIDTAQNYAAGRCEELVGQAIKKYPREHFQILTKQSKNALGYDDVIKGCHESMNRLGIDYIDYFVCHAPNADFDMRDFFKASNQLYKDGLIKNVGVSNFGPDMLKIALETSDVPIALNQVCFSLADDDVFSTGTYEFCKENNIPIQAFRALVDFKENKDAMAVLPAIAEKYNITLHQAVIAYLHSYEVVFTIRSSSKEHWDQAKAALNIKLDQSDIDTLRETHRNIQGNFRNLLLV